jgi:hypothetical protein
MYLVSVQHGVGSRAVGLGVEEHLRRVSGADIPEEQARLYQAPSGDQRVLSLSALSGLAVLLVASGTLPRLLDVGDELLLVCCLFMVFRLASRARTNTDSFDTRCVLE